jgi:hypothetical protein
MNTETLKPVTRKTPRILTYSEKREMVANNLIESLMPIIESDEDHQCKHTPLWMCDSVVSRIEDKKEKSVLVLYNIEFIISLILSGWKGEITLLTASNEKIKAIEKLNLKNRYNIKTEYIGSKNPLSYLEMNLTSQFDIILGNPPYGGTLVQNIHLNFLERCVKISREQVIFVHPSTQYLSKGNKEAERINSEIEQYLQSVTLFNGSAVFGIDKHMPLCITHVNKNKKDDGFVIENEMVGTSKKLDSIGRINIFNDYENFPSIKDKVVSKMIENKMSSIESKVKSKGKKSKTPILKSPGGSYFIRIEVFTGGINKTRLGMWKNDFFTNVGKNREVESTGAGKPPTHWLEFNTLEEAENCLEFLRTDFARFCLAILKIDKNLRSRQHYIPYMDFSQQWNDKKLYRYFSINKEEQKFISRVILPV